MNAILTHESIALNERMTLMSKALHLCETEELSEEEAIGIVNDEDFMNLLFTPYPLIELEN